MAITRSLFFYFSWLSESSSIEQSLCILSLVGVKDLPKFKKEALRPNDN